MDDLDFQYQLSVDRLESAVMADMPQNTAGVMGAARRTLVGTQAGFPADTDRVTISVSTTFHPGAHTDSLLPDLILISSDQVYFHVHFHRILGASGAGFDSLLLPLSASTEIGVSPAVAVTEAAEILNIVVHTIYNMSSSQFAPSFETLSASLTALAKYGISPRQCIVPSTPLFAMLLSYAPFLPIESYALAASHDLYALAVLISPHLLSFSLPSLTDELVTRIGPVYLKRLVFLHQERMEALRSVLLHPPRSHRETFECDDEQRQKLTRVWALASAHLVWDVRPNLSTNLLQAVLQPLEKDLTCGLCKQALFDRIALLVTEWAAVKRTI